MMSGYIEKYFPSRYRTNHSIQRGIIISNLPLVELPPHSQCGGYDNFCPSCSVCQKKTIMSVFAILKIKLALHKCFVDRTLSGEACILLFRILYYTVSTSVVKTGSVSAMLHSKRDTVMPCFLGEGGCQERESPGHSEDLQPCGFAGGHLCPNELGLP
jgi:hypothetical protein